MQRLHLVGFTAELDGLIFSARSGARSGAYVVAVDEQLLDAIRETLRRRDGSTPPDLDDELEAPGHRPIPRPRASSALRPKEIQARLRAGRTIAEVAAEAGAEEGWVRLFAAPVLAEQGQVVMCALRLPVLADRKGLSAESLEDSLIANLIERGIVLTNDELAAGWSAYQVRDTSWVVRFRYRSRRGEHVAQFGFEMGEGTLVALNRLGTDLGWVEAGRPRRPSAFNGVADDRPRARTGADAPATKRGGSPARVATEGASAPRPSAAAPDRPQPVKRTRQRAAPEPVAAPVPGITLAAVGASPLLIHPDRAGQAPPER